MGKTVATEEEENRDGDEDGSAKDGPAEEQENANSVSKCDIDKCDIDCQVFPL